MSTRKLAVVFEHKNDFLLEEKLIGSGGFGSVHTAKLISNEKTVAAKVFSGRQPTPRDLKHLRREASILNAIEKHPNVVEFIGICLSPLTLLLEYVNGLDLSEVIYADDDDDDDEDRLLIDGLPVSSPAVHLDIKPWNVRLEIAHQIASGMQHLHSSSQSVAHMDLKPGNVLLEIRGNHLICCKLADFGLSKTKGISSSYSESEPSQRVRAAGTLLYISPERFKEHDVVQDIQKSKKADVYSFGVILWELRERKSPAGGEDPIVVQMRVMSGNAIPKPKEHAPPGYEEIQCSCCVSDPSQRPLFEGIQRDLEVIRKKLHGMSAAASRDTNTLKGPACSQTHEVHVKDNVKYTPEGIFCADMDTLCDWAEDLNIVDDKFTSVCQYQEALLDYLIRTKGASAKATELPIAFASVFKECHAKQGKFGKVLDEIKEVLDHTTTQIFQEQMGIRSKRVWKSDDEYEEFKRSLVDSKPSLLVAGGTSCGKSTLVNALLGEDILPFAYHGCTAVICEVHHNDDCKEKRMYAVVHLPNEKKKLDLDNKAGLDSLQSYASGKEVEGLKCAKIEIFSPSEFLKYFTIVDSPGVTDRDEEAKLACYFQKKLACGILYVLDAGRPAEAARVGDLVVSNSTVFPSPSAALFILSKWDVLETHISAEFQEEYKQQVKQNLQSVWRGFTDDQLITFRARIACKALKLGYITNDMQLLCEKLKFLLIRGIDCHIVRKLQKVLDFVSVVHSKVSQANLLRVSGERMMPLTQLKEKVREFDEQIRHIWDSVREKVEEVSPSIAGFLKSKRGRKGMMEVASKHVTKFDESALRTCVLKSLWDCRDYLELHKRVEGTFGRKIAKLQDEIRIFSAESGVSSQQPLAEVLKEVVPDRERTVNIDWDRITGIPLTTYFFPAGFLSRARNAKSNFEVKYEALIDRLCQENEKLLKVLLFDVTKKTGNNLQALEQLSEQEMTELKQAMEIAQKSTQIFKSMWQYVHEGCCKLENSLSEYILQLSIHKYTESNFHWLNTKAICKGHFPVGTSVHRKLLLEIPEVLKTEVATTQLLRILYCRRIGPNQSWKTGREHVASFYGSALIKSARVPFMHVGFFFEWCEGGSLAKEIFVYQKAFNRPGGIPKASTYTREILKGLAYLHAKQIFCQALTPADILLTGSKKIKVVIPLFDKHSSDQVLHAAPELLKGFSPDATGDIYSFGVILWEVFYGRPYKVGDERVSTEDLIDKVTNQELRPVWSGRELWRLLSEKCLGVRQNRPEASALIKEI